MHSVQPFGSHLDQAGLQLDDEYLRTLMCETAANVNSLPLLVDNINDPTSLAPLMPNYLLTMTMKSSVLLSSPGKFHSAVKSDGTEFSTWQMNVGQGGGLNIIRASKCTSSGPKVKET